MAHLEDLFLKFKAGYEDNWKNMEIRPGSAAEAKKEAAKLLKNKSVYQQIEKITGDDAKLQVEGAFWSIIRRRSMGSAANIRD
jgi:hypothetical protein